MKRRKGWAKLGALGQWCAATPSLCRLRPHLSHHRRGPLVVSCGRQAETVSPDDFEDINSKLLYLEASLWAEGCWRAAAMLQSSCVLPLSQPVLAQQALPSMYCKLARLLCPWISTS